MDPAAHDESTVDLFASLCDAVVGVGDDEPAFGSGPRSNSTGRTVGQTTPSEIAE